MRGRGGAGARGPGGPSPPAARQHPRPGPLPAQGGRRPGRGARVGAWAGSKAGTQSLGRGPKAWLGLRARRLGAQTESWRPLTRDLPRGPTASVSSRQLPHAPEHPVATLSTSERRAINLTWGKPFDGNSPLIRYVLEMSENSKGPRPPPAPTKGRAARSPVRSAGSASLRPVRGSRVRHLLVPEPRTQKIPRRRSLVFLFLLILHPQAVRSQISRHHLKGVLNTVCSSI